MIGTAASALPFTQPDAPLTTIFRPGQPVYGGWSTLIGQGEERS
jgi:hypothetical protein